MHDIRCTLTIENERVISFVDRVGPQIRDYLGCTPGCIAPVGSGGRPYGVRLYAYLFDQGKTVVYTELTKGKGISHEQKPLVKGRKLVIVDDCITTADTYRSDMAPLKDRKDKFGILDVVVAVEHDMRGLANFAANRAERSQEDSSPSLPFDCVPA